MKNNVIKHQPLLEVSVIEIIKVICYRGNGSEQDPIRKVKQFFDLQGNFLFELDA